MARIKEIKDLGASIRQRLRNLALERRRPVDEILRYFGIERFLYRLSRSPYSKRFVLKGGLMLRVFDSIGHRATSDIDFLVSTSNQMSHLRGIIEEVAAIECPDGIEFDLSRLVFDEIQLAKTYRGLRARFSASLATARIPILIDMGFDDITVTRPQQIEYPTFLDLPPPVLDGYPVETMMAEKLECITSLGMANTRMKDFYDLWTFCKGSRADRQLLGRVVDQVFAHRGTPVVYPVGFTPRYYEDEVNIRRWNAFLGGLGREAVPLDVVISEIVEVIGIVFDSPPSCRADA